MSESRFQYESGPLTIVQASIGGPDVALHLRPHDATVRATYRPSEVPGADYPDSPYISLALFTESTTSHTFMTVAQALAIRDALTAALCAADLDTERECDQRAAS